MACPDNITPFRIESALWKLNDLDGTPDAVEMWCIRCKGEGRFSKPQSEDERQIGVDKKPEWTLNHRRPLLLVRQFICLQCRVNRMIPIDKKIPSIIHNSLVEKYMKILDTINNVGQF